MADRLARKRSRATAFRRREAAAWSGWRSVRLGEMGAAPAAGSWRKFAGGSSWRWRWRTSRSSRSRKLSRGWVENLVDPAEEGGVGLEDLVGCRAHPAEIEVGSLDLGREGTGMEPTPGGQNGENTVRSPRPCRGSRLRDRRRRIVRHRSLRGRAPCSPGRSGSGVAWPRLPGGSSKLPGSVLRRVRGRSNS